MAYQIFSQTFFSEVIMKKFIQLTLLSMVIATTVVSYGQQKLHFNNEPEPDELIPKPFEKKFHWGMSANTYFTTIAGNNLPRTYFSKPSLGFDMRAEYFFKPYVGVGLGIGFQQRGAGIINPDNVKELGNPDSTYRERLRFNTIQVPISLLLRTSKDIIKGIRLSGTFGLVPMINFESSDVFNSVEDGNHVITPVSDQYQKNDLLYQFSIGPDINAGNTIFRIHLVYSKGTSNVYSTDVRTGYNESLGVQVMWLF
jgi:Outer membrane protein beta-barrel domain